MESHSCPAPVRAESSGSPWLQGLDAGNDHLEDPVPTGLQGGALLLTPPVPPLLPRPQGLEEQPEWLHDGVVLVEAVNLIGEAEPAADPGDVLRLGELGNALEHVCAGLDRVLGQLEPQVFQLLAPEGELLLVERDATGSSG